MSLSEEGRGSDAQARARNRAPAWQLFVKYAFDVVVAAVALFVLLPVLFVLALSIWATMGPPVFFRQTRLGRDGKPFEMLKFRSLPTQEPRDAETLSWESLLGSGLEEQSTTRFGRFLRSTSLDELPQLLNVIRGQMALVGPRPERPELVELFAREIPEYHLRHRVNAGITGWAQVHGIGRGRERFSKETLAERVQLDNEYIDSWSLTLDLRILVMTSRAVFRFRQSEVGEVSTTPSGSLDVDVPAEVVPSVSQS